MMQNEFQDQLEKLIQERGGKINYAPVVTQEDWVVINQVYTFHPAIPEVGGKEKIAQLYVDFGMTVIKDMEARATKISHLEARRLNARMSLETIEEEIKEASK